MKKAVKRFQPRGSKKTIPLSRSQFDFILNEFFDRGDTRMEAICHLMFRCVRIGDVLKTLKVQDIYNKNGTLKDKIQFKEEKTNKLRTIRVAGDKFISALNRYFPSIKTLSGDSPLFYTKKTGQGLQDSGVKRLLREFIGKREIDQCSPHSFRKGGAREMFKNGVRIENICDVLNHHNTRTTEIYIDIVPADIEESMACLAI